MPSFAFHLPPNEPHPMNVNPQLQSSIDFFRSAGYGMMVHFGLYSLLGGEWKGQWAHQYAEWIQSRYGIRNAEYEKLAQAFNPVLFNADDWVQFARDCGMKYLVVTSKHHEGFCLYHSKVDRYNSVDATPFRRDLIEELATACDRHGLKLGLYYSQDLDWHDPDGGGYKSRHIHCDGISWDNSWDWPDASKKDYARCYERKILPQVEEITTQYGDLLLLWFDVPMTLNAAQSRGIADIVRKNQPGCLISSRIGNGIFDYVSLGDNEIPDKPLDQIRPSEDMNDICGFKPSSYGLYESACTLNDTWGFSYRDHFWKSADTIRKNREHLNSLGINYLINVGPDGLGRLPGPAMDILKAAVR